MMDLACGTVKYTEYDMAATPYGKGVLKALAEECRKQGIEFGTYYSICDWYHPDYPVVYPDPDYSFREEKSMDPDHKVADGSIYHIYEKPAPGTYRKLQHVL